LTSRIRNLKLSINIAVTGYAFWIAVYNFQLFVNTVVWHDNVDIVAPVWCDIVTKFQLGASIGTRVCALLICVHLYKIMRRDGSPLDTTKRQVWCHLLLIIGAPIIVMALWVIVQPVRFQILEELGCNSFGYTYVGYIIYYAPGFIASLGSAFLASLIWRIYLRDRKERNEVLSSSPDVTSRNYKRFMWMASLDTIVNFPIFIASVVTDITQGKAFAGNYPYVSWKNVHDGAGGNLPGATLSTIIQTPASEWSTGGGWSVFEVKWSEWVYVLLAVVFFSAFGTTPEMQGWYRSAIWFIPERLGYKRKQVVESPSPSLSKVAFTSNPGRMKGRRRNSLSFIETNMGTSETYSADMAEEKSAAPTNRYFEGEREVNAV